MRNIIGSISRQYTKVEAVYLAAIVLWMVGRLTNGALPLVWVLLTGLVLTALEIHQFIRNMRYTPDLRLLLRLISLVMMWVAPALGFWWNGQPWLTDMPMRGSPQVYFDLVIPGVSAFNIALWVNIPVKNNIEHSLHPAYPRFGAIACLLVYLAGQILLPRFDHTAFRHVFHLMGLFWIPAALFAMQAAPRYRWWILGLVLFSLWCQALYSTMFSDFIVAGFIMSLFAVAQGKSRTYGFYASILGLAAVLLLFLLSFKYQYRETVLQKKPGFSTLTQVIYDRLKHSGELFRPEAIYLYLHRFNQGYYVSHVIDWVPRKEPFAHGKTLLRDMEAALLPRFLAPRKHEAGGLALLRQYAGIDIRSYSANIGHFGEAYANFGTVGAWLTMLIYGLLLSATWVLLQAKLPLPFVIFLFYGFLTLETDFGITLNTFTKLCIIVLPMFYLSKYCLKKFSVFLPKC